jgi:Oligosaccharyltransferase 48 kDa subunit beta
MMLRCTQIPLFLRSSHNTDLLHFSLQGVGVLSSNYLKTSPVLGGYSASSQPAPVLFRGIGHSVDASNILAIKALRGNPSTYSANPVKPIDDYPESTGADTLLVTALQARNNARIVVTGSVDMFSNAFFRTKLSQSSNSESPYVGNELFCGSITKWVFGEVGVLRFRDIIHNKVCYLSVYQPCLVQLIIRITFLFFLFALPFIFCYSAAVSFLHTYFTFSLPTASYRSHISTMFS